MRPHGFWMALAACVLVAQTAFVREKVKQLTMKQLYKLDDFYMKLSRDRNPSSERGRINLNYYEKLQSEYRQVQSQKRAKDEEKGVSRAMTGVGPGDTVFSTAEKMATNWVNMYLDERKAPVEQKINSMASFEIKSKDTRRPSSFKVGVDQSRVQFSHLKYTYKNLSNKSDLQLEFGVNVKSVLSYQVEDKTLTWSLSAGF